jgi:hypothetical protein
MKIFDCFKRIHIFHKWGKWSDVKSENWISISLISEKETEIIKFMQDRYCFICGKYEKRYIYK